jgi:hypothetical protein
MNWKAFGRMRPWLILRYYHGIRLERLSETTKYLSQESLSPGRNLNPRPPEYKARVLFLNFKGLPYFKVLY